MKVNFKRTKQVWRADEDHDLAMLVSLHGENGCWYDCTTTFSASVIT